MQRITKFSLSFLFFWVKGSVGVDSRMVKVQKKNTVLGFIPAGSDNQNIPLKNISSTTISSSFNIKAIIIGILILFISLNILGDSFLGGVLLFIIGLGIASSGILTILVIQRSGSDYYLSVPFYEKSKLLVIQDEIELGLSNDADKTDLNLFFDKK